MKTNSLQNAFLYRQPANGAQIVRCARGNSLLWFSSTLGSSPALVLQWWASFLTSSKKLCFHTVGLDGALGCLLCLRRKTSSLWGESAPPNAEVLMLKQERWSAASTCIMNRYLLRRWGSLCHVNVEVAGKREEWQAFSALVGDQ